MPVITNAGGGGGAGSDECTLVKANVPVGLKAVTADSDDEAAEGTLNVESSAADTHVLEGQTYFKFNFTSGRWEKRNGKRKNNGTLSAALNCGESFTIPAGDTVGGKVTANSLASQTPGTATAADIMAGKTATVNGVKIVGVKVNHGTINATLQCGQSKTLPAGSIDGGTITAASLASQTGGVTAEDGYVYSGKTYWKNGVKRTGNMAVNSVLSFSAATYGGRQVLLKWQNPYVAKGKPFAGVEIRYSTGGYPGAGGTVIYTGAGNNTAAGGWSQAVVTLPAYGTGYYFSLRPYVGTSLGTMYGSILNAYAATVAELWLTFTSSQSYTIPAGYSKMDAFAVGGGGGGKAASSDYEGNGGGGGYTDGRYGVSVSPGENIDIVVGLGGTGGSNMNTAGYGSHSSVSRSSIHIVLAKGGHPGDTGGATAGMGGSGGGAGTSQASDGKSSGQGGSDGSGGYRNGATSTSGGKYNSDGKSYLSGQGTTTRAFGTGTLYAGGGGGGNRYGVNVGSTAGMGGAGGGGNGAYKNNNGYLASTGSDGSPNTGGGAGGSGYSGYATTGGSGIVLLHVY